jgi:hypothetical protein
MAMRSLAFILAAQPGVALLASSPVSADSKRRPSSAHVAISLGDGKTIDAKKSKTFKAKQAGPKKANRKR